MSGSNTTMSGQGYTSLSIQQPDTAMSGKNTTASAENTIDLGKTTCVLVSDAAASVIRLKLDQRKYNSVSTEYNSVSTKYNSISVGYNNVST